MIDVSESSPNQNQAKIEGGQKFPHQNARDRIQRLLHSLSFPAMGATYQWLWEYIPIVLSKTNLPSFPPLQSGLKRLENSCIAAIRRGPVPQHIAIIMDGNRRYARSRRIDTAEGHYSGAESLKNVIHFCAVHLIVRS